MAANEDFKTTALQMKRAEKLRDYLNTRNAPPSGEADFLTGLSSDATLTVIILCDDMFKKSGLTGALPWEQYAVLSGVCACLTDAITQFTNLPREAYSYMLSDSINFLLAGADREQWAKREETFGFAVTQYKHMMGKPSLSPLADAMGGAFYTFLDTRDEAQLAIMQENFDKLMKAPDVPDALRKMQEETKKP
ncbi:MAG: hypothetical protein K0R10_1009 [Alphaproteobacteria bacterium]|jgi:hypothetical protein|nr:hypothetical protein [Alphaproteobacteria bacterium]